MADDHEDDKNPNSVTGRSRLVSNGVQTQRGLGKPRYLTGGAVAILVTMLVALLLTCSLDNAKGTLKANGLPDTTSRGNAY